MILLNFYVLLCYCLGIEDVHDMVTQPYLDLLSTEQVRFAEELDELSKEQMFEHMSTEVDNPPEPPNKTAAILLVLTQLTLVLTITSNLAFLVVNPMQSTVLKKRYDVGDGLERLAEKMRLDNVSVLTDLSTDYKPLEFNQMI